MPRGMSTSFGFPPFTRAVKALVIVNVAVYLLVLLSRLTDPTLALWLDFYGYLRPYAVVFHGRVWQLVTYSFLHDPSGLSHLLFNMLGLWMFGAQFEMDFGTRRFYEFYFWCVVGAALTTIGVGAAGVYLHNAVPGFAIFSIMADIWKSATLGASGGIYGLLIAFGILNGNRQMYVFPFPVAIKARYVVAIWLFIAFVNAVSGANGVAEFAHLGGALFGWIYLRFIPRYGLQTAASEKAFGIRNWYYRWKRRRAARKFEVYMRNSNRPEYFDKNGKYRGPNLDKDDDDSHWVN